jgi:hypothetical protein
LIQKALSSKVNITNEELMSKQPKTKTFKSLEAAQREVDIQIALEGIRDLALAMVTTEDIGPGYGDACGIDRSWDQAISYGDCAL